VPGAAALDSDLHSGFAGSTCVNHFTKTSDITEFVRAAGHKQGTPETHQGERLQEALSPLFECEG